jgi:hypothetical protein
LLGSHKYNPDLRLKIEAAPMLLVDTSAWITYFRETSRHVMLQLQSLLDDVRVALALLVKIEMLAAGVRSEIWRAAAEFLRVIQGRPAGRICGIRHKGTELAGSSFMPSGKDHPRTFNEEK